MPSSSNRTPVPCCRWRSRSSACCSGFQLPGSAVFTLLGLCCGRLSVPSSAAGLATTQQTRRTQDIADQMRRGREGEGGRGREGGRDERRDGGRRKKLEAKKAPPPLPPEDLLLMCSTKLPVVQGRVLDCSPTIFGRKAEWLRPHLRASSAAAPPFPTGAPPPDGPHVVSACVG